MKPRERYNARYVWLLATVAALGGLLFGYDFVVIGGAKPFYEKFFQLTSARQIGWANSCALLGCLLGSLVAGAAADRFGRKILLIASAAIFAVSSVLTGWAPTFALFVVWRIAGGVAIGIASNVSPVYIAEVSPAPWRGRLVSMNQFNGRKDRARRTLARIGGEEYAESALADVLSTVEPHAGEGRWAGLLAPGMVRVLAIGVFLAVLQQWSGINVIFNYAEEIYRNAGYGVNEILFNIVVTGSINLVFTLAALSFVDRLGRRSLMLAGCGGVALFHFLLGLSYHFGLKGLPVLLCTLATIACFAMTLGPVTWVLLSEIFPNRIRGSAVSISVSALWIACFALTFTFPALNAALGPAGTFWLYSGICVIGFLFVFRRVPETKGKTLEQIERGYAAEKVAGRN
jgi:MFS family permease